MRSFGTAILYGLLLWACVFAVAILAAPLRETDRPLFESIMPVTLGLGTAVAGVRALGRAGRGSLREGLRLGAVWLVVQLALDALVFSRGPMRMSLRAYLGDIGLTYLIIPVITVALGCVSVARPSPAAGAD